MKKNECITMRFPFKQLGRHWLDNLMKRNNFSLKKANLVTKSKTKKYATGNPFIHSFIF